MKNLYGLFFLFCFIVFNTQIQAQCNWTTVGSGATSTATNTAYNDIAMSASDIPYTTYTDASLSSAVVVKTYSASAWQTVGSLNTYSNSAYTSIAMDGNTPYVAFSDGTNGRKALVRKYTAGAWTTVGTAVTTGTANYISLAVHSGTPYVAYVDVANSSRATVKTFIAGAWVTLGAAISTSTAAYTSLSIDNTGMPYIIYQDVANSNLPTVKRYNGSSWVAVGTGTVAATACTETYIDVSYNNIPYVAYTNASNICTIKTFSASIWQSVGTGTIASAYMDIALALDPAGTPYVAYYELGNYKTSVMKYNGSSWVYAGSANISTNPPNNNSLAITSSGTPYVAIGDGSIGNYVKKLGSSSAITQHPLPAVVCAGTGTTLTVGTNTTGITYQWQVSTGGVYANVLNGPTYNGVTTASLTLLNAPVGYNGYLYRCVVNDNCANLISNSATLTVNALPSVSVTSVISCAGATKTLTASGASTYSWSTGNSTASATVSPMVNTTYTVTGTSVFGCNATAVATVTTISSKTIGGNVTSSAGAVSGNMILYKYSPVLSKWDSVAFTPFSSIYSFGAVDSSWYVVKAVPTSTTNVLVTYGSSAVSWKGATTITHGCSTNSSHNVAIIPLASVGTGTGALSGKIMEGQGFGQRPASTMAPLAPGQPIGGIVVKGGKNPGGQMFAQTTTGSNGTYTLSNLPNNAAGESYFILVDIPGLDTNQTYHKIISNVSSQYTGLDFIVDSARINPTPYVVGLNNFDEAGREISVFPNPAKNTVTIQYTLSSEALVSVELLNIVGQPVKTVSLNELQYEKKQSYTLDLNATSAGLYFIRLRVNNSQNTVKLFITQ